jgi:hypothetical protein
MNSLGEIEDHIFGEMFMKQGFIMDDIQMVVDELLLERSVISLNNAVNLRASGIDKQMGNGSFLECFIEFPQVF